MFHATRVGLVLLGLAAAAPAQFRIEGLIGRNVRIAATIGCRTEARHCEDYRRPVCVPRPCGHWETVCEQVWVPGYWREECVPARYGWIETRCGHRHWGEIEPAHTCRTWVEGYYKTEHRQVWVEGR
jgi:hypothetical protein